MAPRRPRLDPQEVRAAMQAEQEARRSAGPPPAFNSPFAAVAGDLQKLVPQSKKPKLVDRLRDRSGKSEPEPTALAELRAKNKAAREALANSVLPQKRTRPRDP